MDEETTSRIEVWKVSQETLQHFNTLQLQLRNFALTVFVAVLTGAGLAIKEHLVIGTSDLPLARLALWVCFIGCMVLYGFYVMDRGYHQLLKGAASKSGEIENRLANDLPEAGLATSVTKSSNEGTILFAFKNNSTNRLRFFYGIQCVVLAAAGLVSCFTSSFGQESHSQSPVSKSDIKDWPREALKKFVDSGSYQKQVSYVASAAGRFATDHLIHFAKRDQVAVFDIDETALSTWVILEQGNFAWDPERFRNFVGAGHGTAIIPVQRLYQQLRDANIPVVFVTGRPESTREGTMRALEREGFSGYESLFMKSEWDKRSTGEFKAAVRASILASGRGIGMCVGDKPEDLQGGTNDSDFLLPNPFY